MLANEKYAVSPYHLNLLKTYELLDFVDFPFLKVDLAPDGKKYLNHFVTKNNRTEHRILIEVSSPKIQLLKQGMLSVKDAFNNAEKDMVFSCFYEEEIIQKAFQIPASEFKQENPVKPDYVIELPEEYDVNHLTPYHAKYFSHELTKRNASDSVDKLASALIDAQVELNPHQVDAALFAFHSPLSKGVILADEVGLGKTIEAGLVISQKWAERKRKILIIVPSNLRKQWDQELMDKFFLPSFILETKSFNQETTKGNFNPFIQKDSIIICSYHFIKSKESYVRSIDWDLVVIDEAHRLRNVYKPQNKIANIIKNALANVDKKILLTATPLQNSLLELYGLVSIIDDYAFGDIKSYRNQYGRVDEGDINFDDLKNRLAPICKRTLRRQVVQYIPYTKRISLTEEFAPSDAEQQLYDLVSDYLQSPKLYALPASQRQLMTLILRRLLASSTYAISGTLKALADKLDAIVTHNEERNSILENELRQNYESYEEEKDEWEAEEEENNGERKNEKEKPVFSSEELEAVKEELNKLKEFQALAESIKENSKGVKLLTALHAGFEKAEQRGASKKAIIFTESTRTQNYLRDILEKTEYQGKIVLFNGSNNDDKSKQIYSAWYEMHKGTDRVSGSKTADIRAALVEYFRDEADIMIATEAAAEGINLQFCSMVVNYDLPWNPQRIEQRIGRCHRYGQKYDVVVVNFLNKKNEADQRVYELLKDKFKLFDGVFGASDEVLGSIGSGIDFEKRIAQIYQTCRMPEEIKGAFNQLQLDLDSEITEEVVKAKKKLLENFDEEVNDKLKVRQQESEASFTKYESWLWHLTSYYLQSYATINEEEKSFVLNTNPFNEDNINEGSYYFKKFVDQGNLYRLGHPLAQRIIGECKASELDESELVFKYQGIPKISILESLVGQSGWLVGISFTINAFEVSDYVLMQGMCDDGTVLEHDHCQRLFSLPATEVTMNYPFPEVKEEICNKMNISLEDRKKEIMTEIELRNGEFFSEEIDKLDKWGEDRRNSLKETLKELDGEIKVLKKQARLAPNLPEKLKLEKERKLIEGKRDEAWRDYDSAAKDIEKQKDELINKIELKMEQKLSQQKLFTIRWKLI